MRYAAQFLAHKIETAFAGRGKPQVGNHAWYQIHFYPKLRYGKIMQHIFRAQQYLNRLIKRQYQLVALHQNIVLACRVGGVNTKGVGFTD